MEDILLLQLLKKKGIISDIDMHEFHELTNESLNDSEEYPAKLEEKTEEKTYPIDEDKAKHIVSKMYHYNEGKKYIGEKYDLSTAKEICIKHKKELSDDVSYIDIYLAINSHYHNYCKLFKTWFSGDIENKVIESAIIYWFKDDDYVGSKIYDYFKDK